MGSLPAPAVPAERAPDPVPGDQPPRFHGYLPTVDHPWRRQFTSSPGRGSTAPGRGTACRQTPNGTGVPSKVRLSLALAYSGGGWA